MFFFFGILIKSNLFNIDFYNPQTISINSISIINCNFIKISGTSLYINLISFLLISKCYFFNCISTQSGGIYSLSLKFQCEKTCFINCYETTSSYGSAVYSETSDITYFYLISVDKCSRPTNSFYSSIMIKFGNQISQNLNFSNNYFVHNSCLHHWKSSSSKIRFYSSTYNNGFYYIGFDQILSNNISHSYINIFNNTNLNALTSVQYIICPIEISFLISCSGKVVESYYGGILNMINCYFSIELILNNCFTTNCNYWNSTDKLNNFNLLNPNNCKELIISNMKNIYKLNFCLFLQILY